MTDPASNNGFDGLAEGPEGDTPMSFWDHLSELRGRLVKTALGVMSAVVLCFVYATELRQFLTAPLHKAWIAAGMPNEAKLQVLRMTDAFMTDMRIAVAAGIFLAAPIGFYQFWMFIAPGLYAREKKFVIPFVATSVVMFLLGAAFCYYIVLPWTIQWLITYAVPACAQLADNAACVAQSGCFWQADPGSCMVKTDIEPNFALIDYISDATTILVAFGAVFEFPLLIAFLSFAGVVTHTSLLRFWKLSVVLIFILAAFLTPPEPVSQMMMATPMVALFFASIGISYLIGQSKAKTRTAEAAKAAAEDAAEAAVEAARAAELDAEIAAKLAAQAAQQPHEPPKL